MHAATDGGPGLSQTIRTERGYIIAALSGEFDITSGPALREQLLGLLQPAASRLVINLSAVRCRRQRPRRPGGHRTPRQAARRVPAPGRAGACTGERSAPYRHAPPARYLPHRPGRDDRTPDGKHRASLRNPHRQRGAVIPVFTPGADMSDYPIACVNKKLSPSGDEHIVSVRLGDEPDTITARQAYRRMDARHISTR